MNISICIPTYNRAYELRRLLQSIDPKFSSDVVICDDGSTDETLNVVQEFSSTLCINYVFQTNSGRSTALVEAIKLAKEDYVILMDSDDVFLPDGLKTIYDTINTNIFSKSFVFGVLIKAKNSYTNNLPPDVSESNLIALRADHKAKGDFKEVTKRSLLLSCIYHDYDKHRRVPTSIFWSCVSEKCNSIVVRKSVAIKEYLPEGMTSNILLLKTLHPIPLVDLYSSLVQSKKYHSKSYRLRSLVLLARYSLHARLFKCDSLKMLFIFFPAILIFSYDKFVLKARKIRNFFR